MGGGSAAFEMFAALKARLARDPALLFSA